MGAPRKLMACVTDTSYGDGGSGGLEECQMGIHFSVSGRRLIPCLPPFLNIHPQGGSNEGPERFLFFFPFPPEDLRLCLKWTSTKCLKMLSRFIDLGGLQARHSTRKSERMFLMLWTLARWDAQFSPVTTTPQRVPKLSRHGHLVPSGACEKRR